jgi:hypothetical protein
MAGFWGGVLQHAHTGAADGGKLISFKRIFLQDSPPANIISNTVAETTLFSNTIPANVLSAPFGYHSIKFLLSTVQNTGIAQNSPTFRVKLNGTIVLATLAISLPNAINEYQSFLEIEIFPTDAVTSKYLRAKWLLTAVVGTVFATPLQDQVAFNLQVIDFSSPVTLSLTVQNAVANPSYASVYYGMTAETVN